MQENFIFVKINKKAHIYACLYVGKWKNIQQEVIWELILLIYGGILGDFSVLLGCLTDFTNHVKSKCIALKGFFKFCFLKEDILDIVLSSRDLWCFRG